MDYKLFNDYLTVVISDAGAELMSIKTRDGAEYLWQGNAEFWGGRAYNLFPICGRIWEGKYTYNGKTYEGLKSPHGFIRKSVANEVNVLGDRCVEFIFKSDEETKKFYPFDFIYTLRYTLKANRVVMSINVKNTGDNEMIFALGGHPGFNVPIERGNFEDYYLDFEDGAEAKQVYMSDACFATERLDKFRLEKGRILRLYHELFDRDAIVLTDIRDSITLKNEEDTRQVRVSFPAEMKYVGIWHSPKKEAPFVAIEPWTSLPAYDGVTDDLETKKDMFKLEKGGEKNLEWEITIY
ncbi:MAG: aldose 1-epimerase family protein [Clostridia bacterium]|nr:aldose 1-epimerase family protein [Clostridia bacterium]